MSKLVKRTYRIFLDQDRQIKELSRKMNLDENVIVRYAIESFCINAKNGKRK